MLLIGKLIGFGFRQVIDHKLGKDVGDMAASVAGPLIQHVQNHFTDHSRTLPNRGR